MIEKKFFGKLSDGRAVNLFNLKNNKGTEAKIIDYGAAVTSLFVRNKNGKFEDIVLGYDRVEGYENDEYYLGAIVGRYGNRINKGKFRLDGMDYQLSVNNGTNHLHGGHLGFSKKMWSAETSEDENGPAVRLKMVSSDGEEGYPGKVNLILNYSLTNDDELKIEYSGVTDKPTILNPTHHSYFNLSGDFGQNILDHRLKINSTKFTPVNSELIPTGEIVKVDGTPMDFREYKKIGNEIESDSDQLKLGGGYDHNWVLDSFNKEVRSAAIVFEESSGRKMEVLTDQPGLQFYSGNFLDGKAVGKNGINYKKRSGFCLETQYYPDSPNQPAFPSVVLRPGETYRQTTIYKFMIDNLKQSF